MNLNVLWVFLTGLVASTQLKRAANNYWAGPAVEKAGRISVNNGVDMNVLIDAGWYSFSYSKAGNVADRSFGVSNANVVQLNITSCFCPGNFFSVYDNGQPILMTSLQNAPVTTVKAAYAVCVPHITDPNLCAIDAAFSVGTVLLLPGRHNITIVANQSPWGGGTAFMRVDTACPTPGTMMTSANNQVFIPQEPMACCLASGTCSKAIVA